jgi:hypothetical protein
MSEVGKAVTTLIGESYSRVSRFDVNVVVRGGEGLLEVCWGVYVVRDETLRVWINDLIAMHIPNLREESTDV